jgi:hypothetical protein
MYSLASWILAVAAALAFEGPATTAILAIEALPGASEAKAAVETRRSGHAVNAQLARFQPDLEAFAGQVGGSPLLVAHIGEDQTEPLDLPDGSICRRILSPNASFSIS